MYKIIVSDLGKENLTQVTSTKDDSGKYDVELDSLRDYRDLQNLLASNAGDGMLTDYFAKQRYQAAENAYNRFVLGEETTSPVVLDLSEAEVAVLQANARSAYLRAEQRDLLMSHIYRALGAEPTEELGRVPRSGEVGEGELRMIAGQLSVPQVDPSSVRVTELPSNLLPGFAIRRATYVEPSGAATKITSHAFVRLPSAVRPSADSLYAPLVHKIG